MEPDLGNVVSFAEDLVNDKSAGIKLTPDGKIDIIGLVIVGNNQVEILIYNTLANHYTTIPTNYEGSTVSELLGSVSLNYFGK